MRKLLLPFTAFAAVISCTPKETETVVLPGQEITLRASFEGESTKTTLVSRNNVYWLPGDEIAVFSGSSSARFSTDIQSESAECDFTGSISPADTYLAFYPYMQDAACDGNSIKANLPDQQEAVDNNVRSGYLYSAGVSRNGSIMFRNLLSGICFTVMNDDIKYVELRGNDGEIIAGDISVSIDDSSVKTEPASGSGSSVIRLNAPDGGVFKPDEPYYIVCIPTSFKKGISLSFINRDDLTAVYSTSGEKPVELKRSVFGRITRADQWLNFLGGGFPEGELPPDNEIWYTTQENKPITEVVDQSSCTLVSHTFSKGMGVLSFSGPITRLEAISTDYDSNMSLTGILAPDCVEFIGDNLLGKSPNVKEFRVPASLKATGKGSFVPFYQYKPSLERFTGHHVSEDGRCLIIDDVLYGFAPAGLSSYEFPSGIKTIQSSACANSPELKSAVLPSGLKEMRDFSFGSSGIESVTIPASVTSMDPYAFKGCFSLTNLLGDSHFISSDRKFLYDPDAFFPMLLIFFAGRNDSSYEIPEGIQAIENYAFEGATNLKSITFPKSLFYIAGQAFTGCDNLEALYGSHTTSDHKGFVTDGGELQFLVPEIDEDYVVPDDVTSLGNSLFYARHNLRSVKMGDQVTSLGDYVFEWCSNLKSVTLSANLSSMGINPFHSSKALESVYFRSIIPPAYNGRDLTDAPSLKFYVPSKSLLMYTTDSGWRDYWNIMEPYEYGDLPEPEFYISDDYSREGEVTEYQKASEGNGIDLVFMGDAYSDREVESGKYLKDMTSAAEAFFEVEPYKSFRHLFNIYFVTTVSATEGYERGGRSLGTNTGAGTYISGNDAKCFELALKAVKDEKRMDEVLVIVCGNQDLSGSIILCGTCFMNDPGDWDGRDYASGPCVAYYLKQDDSFERTGNVIRHEAGGHGFAKLADEYNYSGSPNQNDIDLINSHSPYRWYSNIDLTSDPSRIKWSQFLSDERYKYDEIGIFEGGFTYQYGVWRPSETSIMMDNVGRFNAPSRYTIWYRIHKLAYGKAWNGTYEDFVAYDAVNRISSAPASVKPAVNKAGSTQPRLHSPVYTGRTWRETVNSKR